MMPADLETLNRRLADSLFLGDSLDSVCVSRSNKHRHHINRLQMRRFAEAKAQNIYVFPATHSRTKRTNGSLKIDELLGIQDGNKNKGPGLFLYTRGMPVAILYNSCTPLGLVNGAKGIAAGIVLDPKSKSPNLTIESINQINVHQVNSSALTKLLSFALTRQYASCFSVELSSTSPSRVSTKIVSPFSPSPSK